MGGYGAVGIGVEGGRPIDSEEGGGEKYAFLNGVGNNASGKGEKGSGATFTEGTRR